MVHPGSLAARTLESISDWIGASSLKDRFLTFRATGMSKSSGTVRAFDFLRDKMIFECVVAKQSQRERTINSRDMFLQIERIYNERKDELESAIGIAE